VKFSIVIPVYKNEDSLQELVEMLNGLVDALPGSMEVVFVVDGSPDGSFALLRDLLPDQEFASQLLLLSRNFGSFPAITAGLEAATGDYLAVMAADLQEPLDLPRRFFDELLRGECDIVLGQRIVRDDPFVSRSLSRLFWWCYKKFVQSELPTGGVDVFACNASVKNRLIALPESNTSLVGLLLWVGFRRKVIGYARMARPHGKSAWTSSRRIRYLKDSAFAFSDLPIRLLGLSGLLGIFFALTFSIIVVVAKVTDAIAVPGYAAAAILIMFFGGLNSLGISLVGEYLWRAFENSKGRPRFIVFESLHYNAVRSPGALARTP